MQRAQERLRALGYYEVGRPDGDLGSRTVGAISAFQHDHHLPVNGELTEATTRALASAEPRVVSPARAASTMDDLRRGGSRIVKETDGIRWPAILTAGAGALYTVIDAISQNWEGAQALVEPLKDALGALPGWAYGVLVVLAALYLYRKAERAQAARLDDERTGKSAGVVLPPAPREEIG